MNIFIDNSSANNRYTHFTFLGEGQYGVVYKAIDKSRNNAVVAIKKIKCGSIAEVKDGMSRSAIREVQYLRELHHRNIISLLDVYSDTNSINLVLEYLHIDLEEIIKTKEVNFDESHVKNLTRQMLRGLQFMHYNSILHRDIKPNNLFYNSQTGHLKLGDFGLARKMTLEPHLRPMTVQVCTIWYRAPELLFGCNLYGWGMDLWSLGCVVAELFLRCPLFSGQNDLDMIGLISQLLGSPNDDNWPEFKNLENCFTIRNPRPPTPFTSLFGACTNSTIDLLETLIQYDPLQRGNASDLLRHPCLQENSIPPPCHNKSIIQLLSRFQPRDTPQTNEDIIQPNGDTPNSTNKRRRMQ